MKKKCYIVGAGDNSGTNFSKKKNEYLIAVDGGLKKVKDLDLEPNLIVGDFDSLGYIPMGDNVVKHPVEKDDTDMMLGIRLAMQEGCDSIEIYGGTGGRIDHTIANFQAMLYVSRQGINIKMIDNSNVYYVITDSSMTLKGKASGNFSLFAMGGDAVGVVIDGGKYPLTDFTVPSDFPIGVSNSYTGSDVLISVKEGSLLIISDR